MQVRTTTFTASCRSSLAYAIQECLLKPARLRYSVVALTGYTASRGAPISALASIFLRIHLT